MAPPRKQTARERLELGRLQQTRAELMGQDIDLDEFTLQMRGKVGVKVVDRIVDARVKRTTNGATTLTVTLEDENDEVLRSGLLARNLDVKLDGLWFRFVKLESPGYGQLKLTFESRVVNVLRTYASFRTVSRDAMTRAQFALSLVKEVKEFDIPFISPERHMVQPIEKDTDQPLWLTPEDRTGFGIPENAQLTVKGAPIGFDQITVANKILNVGASMLLRRKILVASIMCAIQESTLRNLTGGHLDSVGVFQQRASMGWPASRDISRDARAFFEKAVILDREQPSLSYTLLVDGVQRSAFPNAYAQWRLEAERIVTAYGIAGGDNERDPSSANNQTAWEATGGDYQFTRGEVSQDAAGRRKVKKEDTWKCLLRLAEEVQWMCFEVSGAIYFVSEPYLFKQKPIGRYSRQSDGVIDISFDYDAGKLRADVIVKAHMGRWAAPPGSTVELFNMGPVNGRWLVTAVERSLYSGEGEITLAKPRPKLPEPAASNTGLQDYVPQEGNVPIGTQAGRSLRDKIVKVAIRAYNEREHYVYRQYRPMAKDLFSEEAYTKTDCSSFTTLVFKAAGAGDPNGSAYNYNGYGYTGTLVHIGEWTTDPLPGDLAFYGGTKSVPGHVAIYIGNDECIGFGSTPIKRHSVHYRSDFLGFVSIEDLVASSTYSQDFEGR